MHLRSGVFRARKFSDPVPAKQGCPRDSGFCIIKYLDGDAEHIGFDLVPQHVTAATADQQQFSRVEVTNLFQRAQILLPAAR